MNKKVLIVGITALLFTVGLIGWYCFFSMENPLVGTWERVDFQPTMNVTVEYCFFEDQKFLQTISFQINQSWVNQTFLGKYRTSGELLKILYENNLNVKMMNYSYEVSGDTMRLSTLDDVPLPNLTRISNVPLREWPIPDKPITVSPESLVFSIDDLPEGCIYCANRSHEISLIVNPTETYSVIFSKGNCSNRTEGLISIIYKYDSSFDASIEYNQNRLIVLPDRQRIINDSIDTIGDESFAHFVGPALNDSLIYFWFRLSNVVGLINVANDYSFALELTELVEQRIYDSIR